MSPHTTNADGITHNLAVACSETLKELAERATPDAILSAVANLPQEEAEKALYAALNALEELKSCAESVRTLANASPESERGPE